MGQSQSLSIMTAIAITLCIAIATANSNDENEEGMVQLGINGQPQGVDQEYFYRALLEDQVHKVEIDQEGNVVRQLMRLEHSANTPPYSQENAIEQAKYAFAAYCKPKSITAWTCRWCTGKYDNFNYGGVDGPPPSLTDVKFIAADSHQAYTGWSNTDKRIMGVVRGTDNRNEIFDDFEAQLAEFEDGGNVHYGFLKTWKSLKDTMLADIKALVKAHSGKPIYLTGHSLGGAVVQLLAVALRKAHTTAKIILHTFGSPRVGDKKFVDAFNAAVTPNGGAHFRVVWGGDTVAHHPVHAIPSISHHPLGQAFFHTPRGFVYENTGNDWQKYTPTQCGDDNCGFEVLSDAHLLGHHGQIAAYTKYHHHYFNLLPAGQKHMCKDN